MSFNFGENNSGVTTIPKTVTEARTTFKRLRKSTRSDFVEFIKFYNSEKLSKTLTQGETIALETLHKSWTKMTSSYKIDQDELFGLKEYHTILNGPLDKCTPWLTYVDNFLQWRPLLMATCIQLRTTTF
ncbi:hypothetical protein Fcan01_10363 [Folsomia candida]|uniref:Uncharacterized protein n=1 Tax=Folsomia candida TaxID=158441 RepID=A0A226EAN9_FOLCA|nr:hypothetical protein Fcan01_10363 [Folsomia candida]